MKSLLKLIAVIAVFSFVSCTEDNQIVTENGEIIEQARHAIDKSYETNQNSGGQNGHDFGEE